jgi:hypothetical protein
MNKLILKKGNEITLTSPKIAASILGVHVETVRIWCRKKKSLLKSGFEVYTNLTEKK